MLEYDNMRQFDAFPGESDIREIVAVAKGYLDQGDALRAKVRNVAKKRYEEASQLPAYIQGNLRTEAPSVAALAKHE